MKFKYIKLICILFILALSFLLILFINKINKSLIISDTHCNKLNIQEYYNNTTAASVDKLSKIIDGLYLGNINDASNLQKLKNEKIKYIINVTPDIPLYFPKEFDYYRIPIYDNANANISPYINPSSEYIDSNIKKGNVFVHCHAGISRSSTIVISYLILKKKYTYDKAYSLVHSKRPIIKPNSGFDNILRQLKNE
jgi:dual specificity MAP kinase phosphatase